MRENAGKGAIMEYKDKPLKQFLDYLSDMNWHSERVLVEAIMDGRHWLIDQACEVVLQHHKDGYLTDENDAKRCEVILALVRE